MPLTSRSDRKPFSRVLQRRMREVAGHGIRALLFLSALAGASAWARSPVGPIPVKVVILTTYEIGADTGDAPGEFQLFAERMRWSKKLRVAGIEHPVYVSDDGVLGVVTGMRGRPRGTISALVTDPHFDLSHAYWIATGTAGGDPRTTSIGSAVWAAHVVDGDPVFEVDDREIPADWPYGIYALGTVRPDVRPSPTVSVNIGILAGSSGMVWQIDPGLLSWAFTLTKQITLADTRNLAKVRSGYPSEPAAQKPPSVMIGDVLGTVRFWHGTRRTEWARNWVRLWTDGAGTFAVTDCEDQGVLDTLSLYGPSGKVDFRRVLVLRTSSNYTREQDSGDPVLKDFSSGNVNAAYEASFRVVEPVVKSLISGWARYRDALPK